MREIGIGAGIGLRSWPEMREMVAEIGGPRSAVDWSEMEDGRRWKTVGDGERTVAGSCVVACSIWFTPGKKMGRWSSVPELEIGEILVGDGRRPEMEDDGGGDVD